MTLITSENPNHRKCLVFTIQENENFTIIQENTATVTAFIPVADTNSYSITAKDFFTINDENLSKIVRKGSNLSPSEQKQLRQLRVDIIAKVTVTEKKN